jgi:hypothetical protein
MSVVREWKFVVKFVFCKKCKTGQAQKGRVPRDEKVRARCGAITTTRR